MRTKAHPLPAVAVADLAANLLAVMLAAFLLLAPMRDDPGPIDAPILRTPLDGPAMVDALAALRPGGRAVAVVLARDSVSVRRSGSDWRRIAAPTPDVLAAALGRERDVVLFVFSNRLHAVAMAALAGRPWREVSVPLALRSADGQDFASDVYALASVSAGDADFSARLAAFLDGGTAAGGGAGTARAGGRSPPVGEALLAAFRPIGLGVLFAGFALAVFVIERRTSSS